MIMPGLVGLFRYSLRGVRRKLKSWRLAVPGWGRFCGTYRHYSRLAPAEAQMQWRDLCPCIGDDVGETPIEPIYFYQDAWAFEKIVVHRPAWHLDAGSHHKFVALLSKVVPVTMVDLRPLSLPMNSITFQRGSILDLPFADGSVPSVSSLCVVEHIGLGRYGDPLDAHGTEKAISELKRVVAPGGDLYLSVPLDDENRTYFNAHRSFSEDFLWPLWAPFQIVECRYVHGKTFSDQRHSGSGTGCYHLRRPQ
jgi:SAM-dependent methyltransferase